MGTRSFYTFEHGTDGNNVATSGADAGQRDWDLVNGSGNVDFDDAQASHGSMSALINDGSSATEMRWTDDGAPDFDWACRFYFRCEAFPTTGARRIHEVRTAAQAITGAFFLETNGRITAAPASGTRITGTDVAGHAISTNTWYRIEPLWHVDGASSRLRYRIATAADETNITTPFDSDAASGCNLGTVEIARRYYAQPNTGARGGNWWFDEIADEDGLTDYIGPVATAVYPWGLCDGAGGSTPMQIGIIS